MTAEASVSGPRRLVLHEMNKMTSEVEGLRNKPDRDN